MKHAEIKPELWVSGHSFYSWCYAALRVGHLTFLRPTITPTRIHIRAEANWSPDGYHRLRPSQYAKYGLDTVGDCCRIERSMSDTEMIQMVRDLLRLMKRKPLADNAWVAIGGNKYFVSDAEQSYSFAYCNWGVTCLHSSVGNRRRWPYPTLHLTSAGRPLYPIPHVMEMLQLNVDRIADPFVWEKEAKHGWLRLTRKVR